MTQRTFVSATEAQTRALGEALGRELPAGALVLLQGVLGAGKTTFAQGMARGLGIVERVISPSFVLIREHAGIGDRPGLVHMDFYRLAQRSEALDLGIEDYLSSDAVVAVEWPERDPKLTADDVLRVRIALTSDGRRLDIHAQGARAERALAALAGRTTGAPT